MAYAEEEDPKVRRNALMGLYNEINFFADRAKVGNAAYTRENQFPGLKVAVDYQCQFDEFTTLPAAFSQLYIDIQRLLQAPEQVIPTLSIDWIHRLAQKLHSLHVSLDVLRLSGQAETVLAEHHIAPPRPFAEIVALQTPKQRRIANRWLEHLLKAISAKDQWEIEADRYPHDDDLPDLGTAEAPGLPLFHTYVLTGADLAPTIVALLHFFRDRRFQYGQFNPEKLFPGLDFILRVHPDPPSKAQDYLRLFYNGIKPFIKAQLGEGPALPEGEVRALYERLRILQSRFVAFHNGHRADPAFRDELLRLARIRANNEAMDAAAAERVQRRQVYLDRQLPPVPLFSAEPLPAEGLELDASEYFSPPPMGSPVLHMDVDPHQRWDARGGI